MLCQFSVKNYKSFKETATLDLQATNIDLSDDSIIIDSDGSKFLPLAVIYGPNGGGKTNILDSIYSLYVHILRPICAACDREDCREKTTPSYPAIPFKLDNDSLRKPTEFEIFFRIRNYEYKYILHLLNEKVLFESLSRKLIGSTRHNELFVRDMKNRNNNKLTTSLRKISVDSVTETLPWLSYFSITNAKIPAIRDVVLWFHKLDFKKYGMPGSDSKIPIPEGKLKKIQLQMLKEMDIDIDDLEFDEKKEDKKLYTIHKVNGKNITFQAEEESNGTLKLFNILPHIIVSLLEGTTLIIDELDTKLHPKLLKYLIELYKNQESNKKKAQLIFTSHDISTMTPEVFRRDEIWFAAKNYMQASSLYSLVEIKKENGKTPRNDEKYGKQYLEGRYGADPYLRQILNWGEIDEPKEAAEGLETSKDN